MNHSTELFHRHHHNNNQPESSRSDSNLFPIHVFGPAGLGSDCGGIPAPDPSHPPLGVDLEDAWRILTRHLGVDTLLRGGQPCAAAEEAPPRAAALASPCSVGAAKSPTASPPPPPHPAHSSSSAAATAAAAPAAGGPFSVPLTPVRPAAPSSSSPPPPDACAGEPPHHSRIQRVPSPHPTTHPSLTFPSSHTAAPSPSPSWLKRRRVSSAGRCIHSGGGAGRARADKERGPLLVVSLPDGARHTTLLETLRLVGGVWGRGACCRALVVYAFHNTKHPSREDLRVLDAIHAPPSL
jgi:hypothetical protein